MISSLLLHIWRGGEEAEGYEPDELLGRGDKLSMVICRSKTLIDLYAERYRHVENARSSGYAERLGAAQALTGHLEQRLGKVIEGLYAGTRASIKKALLPLARPLRVGRKFVVGLVGLGHKDAPARELTIDETIVILEDIFASLQSEFQSQKSVRYVLRAVEAHG